MPLILGLLVWIGSEIFWLYSILLNIFGKEIVTVSNGMFYIEKSVFGRGPVRKYNVDGISHMRILGSKAKQKSGFGQNITLGVSISFSYDGKPHRFGNQLLEREARFMMDRLRNKLPASVFEK